MRTMLTGSHRDTTDLVRQRMDTLFGPDQPAPRRMRPAASPRLSRASPETDLPPYADRRYGTEEPRARAPAPAAAPAPAPAPGSTHSSAPASALFPAARMVRRLPLALQERLDLDRRAVVGLSVLLVLALGYGVQHFWSGRPEPVAVPTAEGSASPSPPADPSGRPRPPTATGPVVDVAGKVREPGVRTLPPGSRVQDALRAAGGAVPGTDLTGLNLARLLNDGEEIIVGPAGAAVGSAAGGAPGAAVAPTTPLSLNGATLQQLDALPGVGPVLAQRIIQYRAEHGGFTSVDQLRRVSGFGERRLKDLRAVLRP
ncbi:competence protein ComEA [Streptacidiphilus sp. MAP12-16]|uniref:helix-hairpin-helix domain-containing protein n=1 Tax=Streptacidiphilus sp. MAP12-16 TaxID=3156300 RepID=UPI0035151E74